MLLTRDQADIALRRFARRPLDRPDLKQAAVGITVVADGAAFLLTRRAATLRGHAGQWALPGGRADPGESAENAARRELAEELGLVLDADAELGLLDDYATRSGYLITPVVLWAGTEPVLRPNPVEVSEVHRVPLDVIDVEPRFVTITRDPLAIRALVVRGLAVTLVPRLLASELGGVVVRPMAGSPPRRSVFALSPASGRHELATAMIEALSAAGSAAG